GEGAVDRDHHPEVGRRLRARHGPAPDAGLRVDLPVHRCVERVETHQQSQHLEHDYPLRCNMRWSPAARLPSPAPAAAGASATTSAITTSSGQRLCEVGSRMPSTSTRATTAATTAAPVA